MPRASVWRTLAIAALTVTGALIALRAWIGPYHMGGVAINSPVNVEGVFALVFVLAIVVTRPAEPPRGVSISGRDLVSLSIVLLIVAAMFWRSLWFPLLSDDYFLVRQAAHDGGSLWKPFITPGGDGSYRPIGYVLLAASGRWAQTIAWRWHALSLSLHLANTAMVYAAARFAVKRSEVAALCALVFALHGTRPESVTWMAGRWDVLAAFFALGGLLLFLRYYESGQWIWAVGSALLVAAAILNKESAYGFPALAAAFIAARRPWRWRRWAITLIVPAVLLAYRFALFHGPGGYMDRATGRAQILSVRLLPTLKGIFPRFWAALVFPIDWAAALEWWLAAALSAAIAAFILRACIRRSWHAAILVVCTMGVMLPAFPLISIAADLLGSRVLYLPAVPFALLIATLVGSIPRAAAARAIAAVMVTFYAATLLHNLGVWSRVSRLADRVCVAAAPQLTNQEAASIAGIPVAIDGVSFFANGFADCIALNSPNPPKEWTITHISGAPYPVEGRRVLVWDAASQSLKGDSHGPGK